MPPFRAAVCHVAPIFLSAKATTERAIELIHQAARNKANLVVFPESYIPAFPIWSSILPPTDNHDFFKRIAHESIYANGEEMRAIQAAARATNTIVSIGFSEKTRFSTATLYNSNMIISEKGEAVVHHRKLMPTFFEKLTWSPGDGYGLRVYESEQGYGKIGNLICGENTNPLARYTLMAQGEQVHISTWPAVWPTRVTTAAASAGHASPKNYDNVAANKTRAAAHCFEAKAFGILSASFLDHQTIDAIASGSKNPEFVTEALGGAPRGPSMFLDPTGKQIESAYVVDGGEKVETGQLTDREGILYADLDLDETIEGKQYHDVVGGYQRLDVFNLKVDRSRRDPISFVEDQNGGEDRKENETVDL
ncbi:carbon-nitrogen hydrolase [Talaromyces proteolyticus]|uniref:Carbon-nitrogen hydrolase n=1 Tax=Talaromyces proteolyticus TaxID=1131652 RepID=A0AAD4KDS8_9EURO|nr:carbon-nitrogen hydrolase [Talaromyces proteolyticus]KAH8689837.1 carbon-nitrogen hydrolase [Talaromyces proteolyticus]